jgi:hypothetical protein
MSLLTDVLGVANEVTKSLELQTTVSFQRWLGSDGYGAETWGTVVVLDAVVEFKQRQVKSSRMSSVGEVVMSSARITFLNLTQLLAATPAVTGKSAVGVINPQDRIVVTGSVEQPILTVDGFVDGGSGRLIPTEVYLG